MPIFVSGKLQFHEETLSWQRELSPLSSATSVSGLTLAAITKKIRNQMTAKLKAILILTTITVVCSILLAFYPLQFDLYEQLKAKKIVDAILLPICAIFLARYIFVNVKNGSVNWKVFPKEILFAIFIFAVLYLTIIRSVISCGLLFVNCSFKEREIIEVNGVVTNIVNFKGSGKVASQYILTINQKGNELIFESNESTIEKFSVNDQVNIKLKKGVLNLLYK